MKVLVLNGSPKKKSDTFRMTDAFLKGLNKNGGHEVTVINVIDKDIAPCRGCFACWQNMDGHCVIQDDQNAILDLYKSSDLIIWSFPLYCYSMPSHLKAVLDRTIPLIKMRMVQEPDGTVHHEPLADFTKIHTLVICGCGFPDWEGNFESLRLMCRLCFGDPDMIFVPEAPMLNVPQASVVADPLLACFEKAGEEYAETMALSEETLARLERPMIPKEMYIKIVNGSQQPGPVFITLREKPEIEDAAADWFSSKWGVPKEAYLECMDAYLKKETELGWYLCLDGGRIVGGLGAIENDFHDRKDLSPNICAVFTEESYRSRRIAGHLLDLAVEDLRSKGISPVYLVTDHTGFYERYGWEFLCMVQGDGEPELTRMYIHR